MATVLLTGGAGFIGSFIAKELLRKKHRVVIYDSFIQYISPLDSLYQFYLKERLKDIRSSVVIERGDTRDKSHVAHFIAKHRPNHIIHLAALPIADLSDNNPEEALSTILTGTVNLLEAIRDIGGVDRFVYASSRMVYGDFHLEPIKENHPKNPKDIYGGTKLAGEILTQAYGRRFGIEYTIVRPSAVYGPTDSNQRVSQIFLESAFANKELILHGGGEERLDFTYVEDVAVGFTLATFSKKAANEIFNITYGQGRSLKEFSDILKNYFPNLKTVELPRSRYRPKRGTLDIGKAKRLLNYQPKYNLEKGIRQYKKFIEQSGALKLMGIKSPLHPLTRLRRKHHKGQS